MGLREKLAALGERERARRAEIERLLAANPGVLRRASELSAAPETDHLRLSRAPLHELLPSLKPVTAAGGGRLLASSAVVPARPIEPPVAHPRGYCFAGETVVRTLRLPVPGDAMAVLAGEDSIRGVALERLAFLDTETTGLMGNTGTYAFLVGLGYFRASGDGYDFVCEQYFMEDFCHEPAMLDHLGGRLREFDAFVSFNGRAYDLPLLQTRFIMNRMRVNLDRPHLDLLVPCRRMLRPRIGSCSLSNVEAAVLGVRRMHDIDGSLIPAIYLDYVRGGRADRLVPVLDHNAQDVISMGALLAHLAGLVSDPIHPGADDAWVCIGAAEMLRRCGRTDEARAWLERAVGSADRQGASHARRALARLLRKSGDFAAEAAIWRAEIQCRGGHRAEAVVELAKVLEWRLGDLTGARDLVEQALRDLALTRQVALAGGRSLDSLPLLDRQEADLRRRLDRLNRRLANRKALKHRG
ncbi:MAG: ribonuclease H-like domain-containing protein [Candidatus Sumerlaeaceae bacterium]|nr:ribonuclease H-like domain-containing protein [Candidatus Sumerlaeaceae bacterium]